MTPAPLKSALTTSAATGVMARVRTGTAIAFEALCTPVTKIAAQNAATHSTAILDIIQRQAVLTEAVIPKLIDVRGLDTYWMDMLRISRQAVRTAEEYDAQLAARYPMERYRRYTKFITRLSAAANAMRDVSAEIGRIIVQES